MDEGKIVGSLPPTRTLGFRWSGFHNLCTDAAELAAEEWQGKNAADQENTEKALRQFRWCLPYQPELIEGAPLDPKIVAKRKDNLPHKLLPADTEKFVIGVDNADGSDPIEDAAGNRLDGDWTNPTSTSDTGDRVYPSGNGVAGGNFDFRFNVLPGDANQDGVVNFSDLNKVLTNYNLTVLTNYNLTGTSRRASRWKPPPCSTWPRSSAAARPTRSRRSTIWPRTAMKP